LNCCAASWRTALAGKKTGSEVRVHQTHLPPGVAERLGHYVYMYVDPRNERPFYVGKGKGRRILAHFEDARDSNKRRLIDELSASGFTPRLEILAHGLRDAESALRIEAAVIDVLGLGSLTNEVRGWKSLQMGRMTLAQLVGYYAAQAVVVTDPAMLIRINKLYRHNMTAEELYEATRGIWRLGERRENAKYALAVFEGVVREVYHIDSWHPARTTAYTTRDLSARNVTGRWEFIGAVADGHVRGRYVTKSVKRYLPKGLQSPVCYVNA
jgi:hypothetical protein